MIIYNDRVNMILPDKAGATDDYGRPKMTIVQSQAHVRYKITNIYNPDGEIRQSKAQVYIPFSEAVDPLTFNPRIEHITPLGNVMLGQVLSIEFGQNIAGSTQFMKLYL